jgi:hypothetical protein
MLNYEVDPGIDIDETANNIVNWFELIFQSVPSLEHMPVVRRP